MSLALARSRLGRSSRWSARSRRFVRALTVRKSTDVQRERIDLAALELAEVSDRLQAARGRFERPSDPGLGTAVIEPSSVRFLNLS